MTAATTRAQRFYDVAEQVGAGVLNVAAVAGGMAVLLGRILARVFPPRLDYPELRRNMYKMSVKSVPIVIITALFTGAIMVIQAAPIVKRLGAEGLVGWAAGFTTLRKDSPSSADMERWLQDMRRVVVPPARHKK